MKTLSLIKAVFSEDMNLFKVSYKNNSKITKIILPIMLFLLVSFSIGSYAFMMAESLYKFNFIDFAFPSLSRFPVPAISKTNGIFPFSLSL